MDKSKIYGIRFDESIPFGGEERVADSVGLQNDFVVGEHFVRGGKNDFDTAFPFGAIRVCNVKLENGKKNIVFEGEEGFTRSGDGGNVMVQIPKFYSKREKVGSVETWMISGICHPGFSIEPAFLRDGKELDFVYVGAYNSSPEKGGSVSYSGAYPCFCKPLEEYLSEYSEKGLDVYDLAIHIMLQKLILIELGTRRLKYELGGFLFVEYYYRLNKKSEILSKGKNTFTKRRIARNTLYYPGMRMMINCKKPHDPDPTFRTLVKVEEDPEDSSRILFTYDGEDLSDTIVLGESHAGGTTQQNGLSDALSYHTGRCDNRPPMAEDESLIPLVNAFRYRGIENVWGNVWEFCAGLRVKDLQYHYTFDPALYRSSDLSLWQKTSFLAAEQNHLGEWNPTPPIWAKIMGMDEDQPLLPLPCETCHGEPGNFYDAGFYAYKERDYSDAPVTDPHYAYQVAVGGGYDHYWFGSLFTYRCFLKGPTRSWLYSNRVCLRK